MRTTIRIFDLLISSVLLTVLSPVFLVVCAWNLATGEHEIFFRQIRVGKRGVRFKILKFATMVKNSPELGSGGFTEKDDPRLLPLGAFMRKTKINELPQLVNVLRGEMSLVGFRPLTEQSFKRVLELGGGPNYAVAPGITSLASVFLRNEEELLMGVLDKQSYYDKRILPLKVSLDEWWAKNIGIFNYFAILILTGLSLFVPVRILPFGMIKNLPKPLEFTRGVGL